jgi:hypothetical protein
LRAGIVKGYILKHEERGEESFILVVNHRNRLDLVNGNRDCIQWEYPGRRGTVSLEVVVSDDPDKEPMVLSERVKNAKDAKRLFVMLIALLFLLLVTLSLAGIGLYAAIVWMVRS